MNYAEFINEIRTSIPVSLEIDKFINEWGDDLPVMLFGEIGRSIAINLSVLSKNDRQYIFTCIKEGMVNGEEILKSYIATGLLESMYNTSQEAQNWVDIKKDLDSESLKYINAWINFDSKP